MAAPAAGSLIKLPDDRNPRTDADSIVYYYAADGKRYVFPGDKIYFSWYRDFSGVRTVDAATMSSIPLGGNVSYRPGTRLVKLETDPKVYAVEPRGILRPLASEAAAIGLYGPDWAKRVDDLSDAFFSGYRIGAPLDGSAFPSGSVVRRASDGTVFYVDGMSLRRIASPSVQAALGIRDGFVLPTARDLSGYGNGPDLSFPEPALYDTAQLADTQAVAAERAAFTVRADGLGTDRDFVMGAKGVTLFRFSLLAKSGGTNHVRAIALRGFIDAHGGGKGGFSTGSDSAGGTAVYVRDRVPQLSLCDAQGNVVAGPATVDAEGRVSFSGLDLAVSGGEERAYALRADLATGGNFGALPDAIAFDVEDVPRDVVVTGPDGQSVAEAGTYPNGGLRPLESVTVAQQGRAAFTWRGESGPAVAGRRVLLGTLTADAKDDGYDLQAMAVRFVGQLSSIDRVELESGGQTVGMPYPGTVADFENLPFKLMRDGVTVVSAYAVMKPASDTYRGERIQADVSGAQRFRFVSQANGTVFDQVSLREDPRFPIVSTASDLTARSTDLSFAAAPATPAGAIPRGRAVPVLRFSAAAGTSGPARIRWLTFKIEPGDAGSQGTPDALENWARMDGDALDDVDVVNLWRDDASSGSPIGEGDDARGVGIGYAVVASGVKDTTPAGRDSAPKDYGLIAYDFSEGYEPVIAAGETARFTLELATDRLAPGAWSLKASLLGDHDIQWSDATVGSAAPITGVVVPGLPIESPRLTVP